MKISQEQARRLFAVMEAAVTAVRDTLAEVVRRLTAVLAPLAAQIRQSFHAPAVPPFWVPPLRGRR